MTPDLRGFLDLVRQKRPRDLVVVKREVSPRHETTAIITKLEQARRSPVLYFERVTGSTLPLVTNVCGSPGRLALALGCTLPDLGPRYGQACETPIPPAVCDGAPVHDHVLRGDEVDLAVFPKMVYHLDDGDAPYLTGAVVVARDPDTGLTNLSFHRLMIAGPRRTGIFMEPGKHLDGIFAKYRGQGQAMPVAVFLGMHPAVALGSLYSGDPNVEEYDIVGGLLGAPLPVVETVTGTGLPVPAHAEFVLEGRVLPGERIDEGPFGEFTGFGTGTTTTPVLEVDALCHRADPIFQDIVSGHMEHLVLPMPAMEHRSLRDAKSASPRVVGVAMVAPLSQVVALDKQDDDEPRQVAEALLRADIYAKQIIVVDADVDPSDLRQVLSAMALHTQADRDFTILTAQPGTPLDPSVSDDDGRTTKVGIDATRRRDSPRPVTKNRVPQALLDAIDVKALLRGE